MICRRSRSLPLNFRESSSIVHKLASITPLARAVFLEGPAQSLELVGRGSAVIIPVAKPTLRPKRTRASNKVLAEFSHVSFRDAGFSFVVAVDAATSTGTSTAAEGRHLQPRGARWHRVAEPALVPEPADAAAHEHGAGAVDRGGLRGVPSTAAAATAAAKAARGSTHVGLVCVPLGPDEERVHERQTIK